ncbi:hypothetical protein GGI25_000616 [Coemansia spiralis]|uniref:Uncharacterized protein n=2 Tax=Coemansia TaxID=4863 RepID=A0A9W8KZD3_9FUNG|nr:hypothetical protein EDC05_000441 [Coemansia umbellata]KAJ2625516.1 hypothetical protein GGI26_000656 [Coemansia sp. RSA 1358]KAJ2680643.1 hypothetical protein GGI25_000616 [Coemansia spiralis]
MAADRREAIVVGINTGLLTLSLIVILLVNRNRAYIPLKCKNIPLLNMLFLTTLLWYLGDIFTYQPTLVAHATRSVCILTMSWLRMSLGVYSVISCHVFRIYQYQCVFKWRVPAKGKHLWVPILLWTIVPLLYGILASAIPAGKGGNEYIADPPMCVSHKPLYFTAVALLVLLLVVWACATLMMNNINVCFQEHRELLVVIVSTVLVVLLQVVLRWTLPGNSSFAYNTFTSVTDVLIGQISLFVLVSKPLFHCLRDPDEYLCYFLHTLRRENKRVEYEMAGGEEIAVSQFDGLVDSSSTESTRSIAKVLLGSRCGDSRTAFPAFHQEDPSDCGSPPRVLV